jgi:hypothetical protein
MWLPFKVAFGSHKFLSTWIDKIDDKLLHICARIFGWHNY